MVPSVKVVIGSNYGDEGKGLVTQLICEQNSDKKILNILYNGGCQRGHTVNYYNGDGGWYHIFHHFGSGTETLADTYFDSEFIINPIIFIDELIEIQKQFGFIPKVYVHPECRVNTPFDMLLNQIVEKARNQFKHGSCGMGIFETIKRYMVSGFTWDITEFATKSDEEIYNYLDSIVKSYIPKRIEEYNKLGLNIEITPEIMEQFLNRNLINNFINDIKNFIKLVEIKPLYTIANNYDLLLFEGAQGLSLSEDNLKNYPYLTPSKTTSEIPINRCMELGIDYSNIEIYYVTRSYLTRHGAGPMPKNSECKKEDINPDIIDLTNVPNPFQDSIRYGKFNLSETWDNINKDKKFSKNKAKYSLYITQCNYVEPEKYVTDSFIKSFYNEFNNIYKVYDKYGKNIRKVR